MKEDYSWIKVRPYKMDPHLSWEQRHYELEKHHVEETTFLINHIKKTTDPKEILSYLDGLIMDKEIDLKQLRAFVNRWKEWLDA